MEEEGFKEEEVFVAKRWLEATASSRKTRLAGEYTDATGEALEAIYYEGETTRSCKTWKEEREGES